MRIQLSYGVDKGFLTPIVQLISVTNTIEYCVQHRTEPVECYSTRATQATKPIGKKYDNFKEYLEVWLPIVNMEASTCAVLEPEDVAVIRNCQIKWTRREVLHPITQQAERIYYGKLRLDKKLLRRASFEFR